MRRAAFTLIELLVIIGIMATMVTVGVVGMNASRASTRLYGAGRDVMAMIRRARSSALITQRKVTLSYSNASNEDGPYVKVSIGLENDPMKGRRSSQVVTALDGRVLETPEPDEGENQDGESLLDVLSPDTIPLDVVQGLRIKVLDETDALNLPENETRRSKISIFSSADASVNRTADSEEGADDTEKNAESVAEAEESLSVAFAANGRVTPPHRIYLYRDGTNPEDGIVIRVVRFGDPVCGEVE